MSRRILIVDGLSEARRKVRRALLDGNFTIYEAATQPLAMRMAAVAHPDLVVLDQALPGSLQLCQQLRADPRFAAVPILLLSEHAETTDRQAALAAGASQFLSKPFMADKLRSIVSALLSDYPPATLQ
jgi:DNA-binding response OmpR family regulator